MVKKMTNALFIQKLRKKHGFSQKDLAKQIGISRPTFIQIEKGKRELNISEAKKLAEIFGLSLNSFLAGESPKDTPLVIKKRKDKKSKKPDVRISVPQKNIEKFREVLLYILEKVGAKPNIGETAIYKLLYFIDFDFYEKYEEQLIGATYIKNNYGPTPKEFKAIVENMEKAGEIELVKSKYFQYDQKKYLPRRPADLKVLSAQEIQHIDEVLARLAWKNATELSNYSHSDTPWRVHKMGEEISYETVFYRDDDHSVRNYEDEL